MCVLGGSHSGIERNTCLDNFASGSAEIVPLEIGAFDSRLLRPRNVDRKSASNNQNRYCHDSSHFHFDLLCSSNAALSLTNITLAATVTHHRTCRWHPDSRIPNAQRLLRQHARDLSSRPPLLWSQLPRRSSEY